MAVNILSLLLRMLLSLTLLLNGVGVTHVFAGSAPPAASTVQESPCPDHDATASVATPDEERTVGIQASGDTASADCCTSSSCRCACAHAGAWVMAEWPYLPAHFAHDFNLALMARGHLSPAMPHLIRPPIG